MLDRPLFSSLYCAGFFAVLCFVLAVPSPSLAGFQWVPPTAAGDTSQQAPDGSFPQAPAVVIEGVPAQSPAVPSQPVTRAPQTLQFPQETGATGATTGLEPAAGGKVLLPPAPAKEVAAKEKIVRGFANNVPLAVALRQILPSEYGFSVGQDVQLSTLVSWQGGRTWRPILTDMLQAAGLSMREEGKMIQIVRSAENAQASTAPGPAPSLQPLADSRPVPLAPSPPAEHVLQPPPSAYVPPTAFSAPASRSPAVDSWTANRGETLRKVLESWARRANIELSWQAEYDYPLQASITLTGTFEDAVRSLLAGFQEAQPQPVGSLHNSSAGGQAVLVVQTRGNNYSE